MTILQSCVDVPGSATPLLLFKVFGKVSFDTSIGAISKFVEEDGIE
jgi:hypothetical protein